MLAAPARRPALWRPRHLLLLTLAAATLAGCRGADAATDDSSAAVPEPTATVAPATPAPTRVAPTTAAPTTATPETTAPTTAAPATAAPITAAPAIVVTEVVDGDTVRLSTGVTVRLIGIDTPERGQCGYREASARLEQLVTGQPVTVTPGARDDVDRYGRALRYLDVNGIDVGLVELNEGLARARYDSRDGYGRHDREGTYVAADAAAGSICALATPAAPKPAPTTAAAPATPGTAFYANCTEARAAGAAPISVGEPGYRSKLDRDNDGVACE